MRIKAIHIVGIAILVLLTLAIIFFATLYIDHVIRARHIKSENQEALAFMAENKLSLYAVFCDLLELDNQSGNWLTFKSSSYARHKYETNIERGYFIYRKDEVIYMVCLEDKEKIQKLSIDNMYGAWGFALSPGEGKLAFLCYLDENYQKAAIIICDLSSKQRKIFYEYYRSSQNNNGIYSPCWSGDGESLIFSQAGKIFQLDLKGNPPKEIAEGYWAATIGQNKIAYWRDEGEYSICYKKDLNGGGEIEVIKTDLNIKSADWEATGRFVVVAVPGLGGGFFNVFYHVTMPFVFDTATSRQYRLPHCGHYTTGYFLENIKGNSDNSKNEIATPPRQRRGE